MQIIGAENGKVRLLSDPFKVLVASRDGNDVEEVMGRFRWAPPRVENMCRGLAEFYLRFFFNRVPTDRQVQDFAELLILSWVLRKDSGDCKEQVFPFPPVVDKDGWTILPKDELLYHAIRDCDIQTRCPQGALLYEDYLAWVQAQFPNDPTPDQMMALMEDAKKKSLWTLLSEQGFWRLVRLARGLDVVRRNSGPGSGTAG